MIATDRTITRPDSLTEADLIEMTEWAHALGGMALDEQLLTGKFVYRRPPPTFYDWVVSYRLDCPSPNAADAAYWRKSGHQKNDPRHAAFLHGWNDRYAHYVAEGDL